MKNVSIFNAIITCTFKHDRSFRVLAGIFISEAGESKVAILTMTVLKK